MQAFKKRAPSALQSVTRRSYATASGYETTASNLRINKNTKVWIYTVRWVIMLNQVPGHVSRLHRKAGQFPRSRASQSRPEPTSGNADGARYGCNAGRRADAFPSAMDYGTDVVGGMYTDSVKKDVSSQVYQEQIQKKQDKHISESQSSRASQTA